MRIKKRPMTVRSLKKEVKSLQEQMDVVRNLREGDRNYWIEKERQLKAQPDDKTDLLLPQKQALLKELSYLVNATSRAVRTTMWSLKPPGQRGGW